MSAAYVLRAKKAISGPPGKSAMKQLDSRRYTGPNLLWDRASAVMDIDCNPGDTQRIVEAWQAHIKRLLAALCLSDLPTACHRFARGGVSLALAAPVDMLYAAIDINDAAWHATHAQLTGGTPVADEIVLPPLREALADERNDALTILLDAAAVHKVTALWDDDEVSFGLGRHSKVWPADALPAPTQVDWSAHHDVPIALVTGTNGKTTSVRMAASMVRAAGLNVGLSSTDWVGVNDRVIDTGDYSGPGGARLALRQSDVDVAILETARGGLLRRGLGVARVDAALITNIAEDHLGDFGSRDMQELLDCKWIVTRALDNDSVVVLNADDALLVSKSQTLSTPIVWFALVPDNPVLVRHIEQGGAAWTIREGALARCANGQWHALCKVDDIPLTMNGAARHNIANALGAAALSSALGVDDTFISHGLTSMTAADNPGRGNLFVVDDVEVLVDFAHNPQGMAAIFNLATRRDARRRLLAFGQAGDRTDDSIREQAQVAWQCGFDRILISELAAYRRGREPQEVFHVLRKEFLAQGARDDQIAHHELELDALREALDWAKPGDLIVMLALGDATAVMQELSKRGTPVV